jgi:predicted RNase H-like nuclease
MPVIGVDGCPDGWVAVTLDGPGRLDVRHLPSIADLDALAPPATIVAVDMPMWFPVQPPRRSEVAAREVLGPKASSIFATPIRAAVEAPDHASANAISRDATGGGVSRQAFALAAKILEVDAWRHRSALDVREVHPETSFAILLGRPATASKRTWAGAGERRAALARVGIDLTPFEGASLGKATVDDVLDAAVAAWTAGRIAAGTARRLPADPGDDPEDVIWA